MKNLHGVFVVLPLPDLVALGDKVPNPILNSSSRGNSVKHLSPEMKMLVRRFLLSEIQESTIACLASDGQGIFIKAFYSPVQDIGNI